MNLQFGLEQNQPQSLLHDQWWCNLLTTKMLLIKKPYFYVIVVLAHLYQPVLIIVDIWIATVHTIHNMLPLRFPFKSFKKILQPIQILSRFPWPVNFQMAFEDAQLTDALPTVQAAVKLFSNRSSFMVYFQQPILESALPTEAPLVRLLSRVNPLVLFN